LDCHVFLRLFKVVSPALRDCRRFPCVNRRKKCGLRQFFIRVVRGEAWTSAPASGEADERARTLEGVHRGPVRRWGGHRPGTHSGVLHFNKSRATTKPLELMEVRWKIKQCWWVKTAGSLWKVSFGPWMQARNQLGTPGGRRVFWGGPKFFKLGSTHFYRGAKNFPRELSLPAPLLVTGLLGCRYEWSLFSAVKASLKRSIRK